MMKKLSKSFLLASTALLWWIEGNHPIFAMNEPKKVDFKSLTIPTLPGSAKLNKDGFFQYLDTLKETEDDPLIEEAKKAYENEAATPHFKKMQAALTKLAVGDTTKELTKEEREQRERTEKEHEKLKKEHNESKHQLQKVEEEKHILGEAFNNVKGFTNPWEIQAFLQILKETMSGFSDGLFLMKFKGDEEPEFEKTLTKIAEQAKASAAMKKEYEQDKRIKKLDIFLQLPSKKIDLNPINKDFEKEKGPLAENFKKKIEEFSDLVKKVKSDFETIGKKHELRASQDDNIYFNKFWLNDDKEERKDYEEIFSATEELKSFYNNLIKLLEKKYKNPAEFKKEYDLLLKQNEGILSSEFSSIIGGDKLEGNDYTGRELKTNTPTILLSNISGLSLYHHLRLRKNKVSEELKQYITTLMGNIKKMRTEAYELKSQIGEPKEVFMKFDEGDPDFKLGTKMMGGLLGHVGKYERSIGENALQNNIKNFLLTDNRGFVDFNKIKNYKEENSELEKSITFSMRKLKNEWEKLSKSKGNFYKSKALKAIFESDLINDEKKQILKNNIVTAGNDNSKKSLAINGYDNYLSGLVKKYLGELEVKNNEVSYKLLFDELPSLKLARDERNKAIESNNQSKEEKDKKEIEKEPAKLTLETTSLGALIQISLNKENNLLFEDFWKNELENNKSDIAKFMNALKEQTSRDRVKDISKAAFDFLKGNSEEQKQLINLFNRVVEAKKYHDDFMHKMRFVKETFEPLENASHTKPEIQKKMSQLKTLLAKNSDEYLKMEPEERAVNYAYNFPMFYVGALKPLDKDDQKMKIWGGIDDTAFDAALKEAHEAYLSARNAIQAINPTANQDSIGAVRLGGFEVGQQIHQLAQSFEIIPIMHMQQGGGRGGRGGPGGGARGGPRGTGLGGGGQQPVKKMSETEEREAIMAICNECNLAITKVMSDHVEGINGLLSQMFENVYKVFIEMPTEKSLQEERRLEIGERENGKKKFILESVTKQLTEEILQEVAKKLIVAFEYQYIDQDRPLTSTILETIKSSSNPENIKEKFAKILKDDLGNLKKQEEINAKILEKRKEKKNEAEEVKERKSLQRVERKENDKVEEKINPFGKPLKKVVKIEDNKELMSKTEKVESEVTKIQPTGATEVLKKEADQKRLEKIKEFLKEEKDLQFVEGFADAELLAFPLWTILDLKPSDLQNLQEGFDVDSLKHRKFSSNALQEIKKIRFNKNDFESVKSRMLSSDVVKKETPRELLGTTLQVHTNIMKKLFGDGDIK